MKKLGMQPSLQTKGKINANEGKEKTLNWKNCIFKGKIGDMIVEMHLCWSFCCVNDNKPIDVKCFQLMRCNICYANLILIINAKTQARKGLILYNFTNGINASKNMFMQTIMWLKKN
jgi:hypothetical protein